MSEDPHHSAAAHPEHVAAPASVEEARETLKHGPRGALAVASITTTMLILGWLVFYFFLFIPRGVIR